MTNIVKRAIMEALSEKTGYAIQNVERAFEEIVEDACEGACDDRFREQEDDITNLNAKLEKEIKMLYDMIGKLRDQIVRQSGVVIELGE